MQQGIPFGDAYLVNLPETDRMGATLYAEQRRKELEEKKTNDLLDAQFAKELGGIRSTDVPELTNKYAIMKSHKKGTYGKKLKDEERISLQQQALQSTADVYKTLGESKEVKKRLEDIQMLQKKNPNDFSPEYANLMQTALSLPTAKLKAYNTGKKDANGQPIVLDLTNPDTYAYQLGSTDFTKEGKLAMGDIKQKRGKVITIDTPDKMGTINVEYTGINSPDQYLQGLQQGVVGSKKTSDFLKEAKPLLQDEANIIANFDALTKTEAFQNAYPDFKGFNPMLMNTDLGKAMILTAMKAHTISPPREIKSNPIPKWKAQQDYKQSQKKEMAALQNAYVTNRMKLRASLGLDNDEETQGVVFDRIGDTDEVEITSGSPATGSTTSKGAFSTMKKEGKIVKGIVYNSNGDVMSAGEFDISKDKLPADMIAALNKQKIILPTKVKTRIKNGQIDAIMTPNGTVDRLAMVNFQEAYDNERKGNKLNFTKKPNTPASNSKKKKINW